jgi:hypothetical protein
MRNAVDEHEDAEDWHRARPALQAMREKPPSGRLLRRAVSILGFTVAVLVLTVAIFAFRLSQGPVGLPFLDERVLQVIGSRLPPGSSFSLQEVAIARRAGGLALTIVAPSLSAGEGRPFLGADAIHVSIDLLSLLTGSVQPTGIEIVEPRIAIARKTDGHLSFRDMPDSDSTRAQGFGLAVGALENVLNATGTIRGVLATDLTVSVDNLAEGTEKTFPPFDVTLRRTASPGGLSIIADGKTGGRLSITTERRTGDTRYVEINARDLSPFAVAAALVPGGPAPEFNATLAGTATLRLDRNGRIETGALNLRSAGGTWSIGPHHAPFRMDEGELRLSYDGDAIAVERAMVRSGAGAANFKGTIRPPSNPDDPTDPIWRMSFQASGMTLAGPREDEPPLLIDSAVVEARYDPRLRRIGIDRGSLVGRSASLEVLGSISFGQHAPGIGLSFVGSRMPVSAFKRFWPFFAAVEAREWFAENVTGGTIESARLKLAIPVGALAEVNGVIPPLPDAAVDGEFVFSGSSVTFAKTMPPMVDASAFARFTGRTVDIRLDSANVKAGEALLAVSGGRYQVLDLAKIPADTRTSFKLTGPAAGIATLMKLPPLADATNSLDFDPAKVTGEADLDILIDVPLGIEPTPQSVDYKVVGSIVGMTVEGFEGNRLENATLDLDLAPEAIRVDGKGTFAGAPASLTYIRTADALPDVEMSVTLDDKTRAKQGFPLGSALSGPVRVDVDLSAANPSDGFEVSVDLTAARVNDLLPGWQKNPGRAAKASFRWLPAPDGGGAVKDFKLEGGAVSVSGEAFFDAKGAPTKISLPVLKIQPGDDARSSVEMVDGKLKVALSGSSFDVRGALRKLLRGEPGSSDVDLSVDLGSAVGFNDTVLSGLRIALTTKGGAITKLAATGQFGNSPASADLGKGDSGEPLLQISSSDAGALMRFLNYYAKVVGGRVDARITPDLNNARGVVFMRNFAVRNEPALAQFFSNARAVPNETPGGGVLKPSSNAQADARFTKLRLAFSRTPARLTIDEGVVWGPEVGASISGFVDYAQDRINITGTFVPAYALNNLFGQIPILGILLGGGQYGGLFAITFRVAGPIVGPTLTVNPLSGIAPGFLRKLFEFQKE